MDKNRIQLKTLIYEKLNLNISNFEIEEESQEYEACQFELNNKIVISRKAKITPKKIGQFVTFWKRINGVINPYRKEDTFDFFVINVQQGNRMGQFIFSKSTLMKKGIVSFDNKEGKRGFRVYSVWDEPISKQAIQTQKWQLDYFIEVNDVLENETILELLK